MESSPGKDAVEIVGGDSKGFKQWQDLRALTPVLKRSSKMLDALMC